jgi:ribosomal protein S18 acetylase RimI-like enzyme
MESDVAGDRRRSRHAALNRMTDFLIVDENLRTAMRFFGEATGSGEVIPLPGAVAIFSGLDYGVFNIAMLDGRVTRAGDGLETRLAEIARYFKKRTLRWSFWLCEDLLDPGLLRRARQTLADFGLRAISHPPGMMAPMLLPPVKPLPSIEVRRVANETLQRAFTEITAVSFDIPYTVAHAVYSQDRAWRGDYWGFVGMVDTKPVSIAAIVAAAGALGVYSLATYPIHRHQGYGEAMLRAAVSEVQRHTGIERVVLQSTEAGYALYHRMGFREVTRYSVYLTK